MGDEFSKIDTHLTSIEERLANAADEVYPEILAIKKRAQDILITVERLEEYYRRILESRGQKTE